MRDAATTIASHPVASLPTLPFQRSALEFELDSRDSRNSVIHMRNVTISVDEESYRAARVAAAHRGVSVSRLVRDFFHSLQPPGQKGQTPAADLLATMDREGVTARVENRDRDRSHLYDR